MHLSLILFTCFLLTPMIMTMRIPEIQENFIADYTMSQPIPNSGKYYRSFTNQIERFDAQFFGMVSTSINYYRCNVEWQKSTCQKQALTNEMYPMQLPPWAEYRGPVVISGQTTEHWHFNMSLFDIKFDIYVKENANGQVVPVRQRFEVNEMFTFVADIEFANVVVGEVNSSLLLMPECPQAPESVDKCNNHLFPVIREERFVFLLDVSGSMNEAVNWQGGRQTRMNVLKSQFEETVQNLKPTQNFNVVTFSTGHNALWRQNMPANDTNVLEAIKYVNSLQANGGTNLLDALVPLMQDGLQSIYLLSDGMPNQTPSSIISFVEQRNAQMANPIKIHATAFAADSSATSFMRNIADVTGGIFTDINSNNQ